MEFWSELFKNIPWKKLAPWAIILLVINILTFWSFLEYDKVPVSLLFAVVIISLVIVVVSAIFSSIIEMKKNETSKKPTTEQIFKDDVTAPESEFGIIKGKQATNGQTKTTFNRKVDAPGSKFGNIEE